MWTLNTVGSSPPSEWLTVLTFDNNLKESIVPDQPTNFKGWFIQFGYQKRVILFLCFFV